MSLTDKKASPLIIAEIGTSHAGDLNRAVELIDAAVESGADCIKFQHVYADEIIHPETGIVDLPGGPTPLFQVFRSLEVSPAFLARLKEETEKHHAVFLCSPFGPRSLQELVSLKPKAVKIASPELNHFPLLDLVNRSKLAVFLSTGVSLEEDIDESLSHLPDVPVTLLHCITSYPAPEEEYNLNVINTLQQRYALPVGVSDHSLDPLLVPLLSYIQGAVCIEKHFTLGKTDGGLDDLVALTPNEFGLMTSMIRQFSQSSPEDNIQELENRFGKERINRVKGSGIKNLAPSEKANYGRTNRTIHALRDIEAGEIFSPRNIAVLRTEKILTPGLSPRYWYKLIKQKAARFIPAGEGVNWSDVE